MKHLLKPLTLAAILTVPSPMLANPYCAELAEVDQLPKKYAKRGPFYADTKTGWIVGADQLKNDFTVADETISLWTEINAAFEEKGTTLAVLAAPPRALFAPKLPKTVSYDTDKSLSGFSDYVSALNDAGIAAPDLTALLQSEYAADFYFARDTHWTPKGAAVSAALLAEKLTEQKASEIIDRIQFSVTYSEKGSLSTVVEKTCGVRPKAEIVTSPVYSQQGGASALLDDISDQAIALVGTSFSDRYQRDTYQVSGAVSHAMKASVDNFSVTGGGLVGAMEAFILGGALSTGRYKTVVWEAPYTAPLTNISGLRQILGALHQGRSEAIAYEGSLSSDWTQVDADFSTSDVRSIRVQTPGVSTGKLELEFFDAEGQKTRVKLSKSDRVRSEERSDIWNVSLTALPISNISRFKVKIKSGANLASVRLIK